MLGGVLGWNAATEASATEEMADTLTSAANQYNPYMTAGSDAVSQWSNYSGVSGMDQFTSDYLSSDTYSMLSDTANESALANASATGSLRTGSSDVALAEIASGLVSNAYSQQLSNLSGLTSTGLNATSGYNNAINSAAGAEYNADTYWSNTVSDTFSDIAGGLIGGLTGGGYGR